MNNSLKFFLPILAISLASCALRTVKQHITPNALAANKTAEDRGLITISSPYDVSETGDRVLEISNENSLTLFARLDHSANATDAELELNPTELLILGNPQVGTPLMQCSITTAIDLPQKILVYQDKSDRTQIAYNQPKYLQQRHNMEGCNEAIEKVSGALKGITEAAVK